MAGTGLLVGVDFTADTLRLVLGTLDGEFVATEEWPLPELPDEEAWSWEVGGRISALFGGREEPDWALGVGIACPGIVDGATGRLVHAPGMPAWDGLHVVDALRRNLDAPIVALNRTAAALRAESAQGVAIHVADVLLVSLRDRPEAAILTGGRAVGGHTQSAGALPALPLFEAAAPREPADIERSAGILADAAALLDPELVILDGEERDVQPLGTLLQRVIDEVAPGPSVVASSFGERGPVAGAMLAAAIVAYEGRRSE